MSDLTYRDVVRILEMMDAASGMDMELSMGDLTLKVTSRPATSPAPGTAQQVPQPSQETAPPPQDAPATARPRTETAADHAGATVVSAPMSGTFYAAPEPGKPPFAVAGQTVRAGDQLGIVEIMKLFTPITAPVDGTVRAVLVENQQTVAKDDPLVLLDAE